ncbi:MAG: hypothetical protein NPIRA05_15510 [Nitrospirales bacterium]|nr:MAG: hypothetical protein NPIRA05_15510 [Nitrospirales bacterium]
MFWIKKVDVKLKDERRKVVLERSSLFGPRRRIKFIETTLPSMIRLADTNVISVTHRRRGWRFRLKYPLQTTYYKRNPKGKWIQIGKVYP